MFPRHVAADHGNMALWKSLTALLLKIRLRSIVMPITPFLRNQSFDPELVAAMSVAFTNASAALGLADRTDQITALVAGYIIGLAQKGVRTSEALYLDTMREFKADHK
jgi:hypothetical protein